MSTRRVTQTRWGGRAGGGGFHYAAGPNLTARLAARDGRAVAVCLEANDARFAGLLREANVLEPLIARMTGGSAARQFAIEPARAPAG